MNFDSLAFNGSTMADDQLEWVFDSLVEFLRGPIWNIPVLTFIEQKSVVFEPGAENEEELRKIHEAYKNLVDFMLGSYMEDLNISPEEFEKSCCVASKRALNQFHQSLFQQVWAADDFEIFKRMMTQKNLELQLQALEFLTQKRGSVPDCMEPVSKVKDETEIEETVKRAIVESDTVPETITQADRVLQEKMKQVAEKEKELLEQAMLQSVRTTTPMNSPADPPIESTEENNELQELNNVYTVEEPEETIPDRNEIEDSDSDKMNGQTFITEIKDSDNSGSDIPLAGEVTEIKEEEISSENVENIPPKTLPPLRVLDERPWSEGHSGVYNQAQIEISPLDLETRQNYLRQQRDRILALKKQERARRLSTSEEVIAQTRPKSARAAKKVLREENADVHIDPQTLAFRKSLAAKLRSEVIDKTD